jgi:hypothetical protein
MEVVVFVVLMGLATALISTVLCCCTRKSKWYCTVTWGITLSIAFVVVSIPPDVMQDSFDMQWAKAQDTYFNSQGLVTAKLAWDRTAKALHIDKLHDHSFGLWLASWFAWAPVVPEETFEDPLCVGFKPALCWYQTEWMYTVYGVSNELRERESIFYREPRFYTLGYVARTERVRLSIGNVTHPSYPMNRMDCDYHHIPLECGVEYHIKKETYVQYENTRVEEQRKKFMDLVYEFLMRNVFTASVWAERIIRWTLRRIVARFPKFVFAWLLGCTAIVIYGYKGLVGEIASLCLWNECGYWALAYVFSFLVSYFVGNNAVRVDPNATEEVRRAQQARRYGVFRMSLSLATTWILGGAIVIGTRMFSKMAAWAIRWCIRGGFSLQVRTATGTQAPQPKKGWTDKFMPPDRIELDVAPDADVSDINAEAAKEAKEVETVDTVLDVDVRLYEAESNATDYVFIQEMLKIKNCAYQPETHSGNAKKRANKVKHWRAERANGRRRVRAGGKNYGEPLAQDDDDGYSAYDEFDPWEYQNNERYKEAWDQAHAEVDAEELERIKGAKIRQAETGEQPKRGVPGAFGHKICRPAHLKREAITQRIRNRLDADEATWKQSAYLYLAETLIQVMCKKGYNVLLLTGADPSQYMVDPAVVPANSPTSGVMTLNGNGVSDKTPIPPVDNGRASTLYKLIGDPMNCDCESFALAETTGNELPPHPQTLQEMEREAAVSKVYKHPKRMECKLTNTPKPRVPKKFNRNLLKREVFGQVVGMHEHKRRATGAGQATAVTAMNQSDDRTLALSNAPGPVRNLSAAHIEILRTCFGHPPLEGNEVPYWAAESLKRESQITTTKGRGEIVNAPVMLTLEAPEVKLTCNACMWGSVPMGSDTEGQLEVRFVMHVPAHYGHPEEFPFQRTPVPKTGVVCKIGNHCMSRPVQIHTVVNKGPYHAFVYCSATYQAFMELQPLLTASKPPKPVVHDVVRDRGLEIKVVTQRPECVAYSDGHIDKFDMNGVAHLANVEFLDGQGAGASGGLVFVKLRSKSTQPNPPIEWAFYGFHEGGRKDKFNFTVPAMDYEVEIGKF